MGGRRAPGDPEDPATGVGIPPRAAEAGERRHHHDAAAVGNGLGEWPDLGGVVDEAETVSEPLHGGAGDEDRSLVGIRRHRSAVAGRPARRRKGPRHGGEESVDGVGTRGPDVHEDERAGAVGVLGGARGEARLAEQRRLLVAGDPRDRHAGSDGGVGGGDAEATRRRSDVGQDVGRHTEQVTQFVRPCEAPDVEQHRAGGIGGVGDVGCTAGELPHEPRVDRAERHLGSVTHPTRTEQPLELGGREVGIEDEPGGTPHERKVAADAQGIAAFGGPPVLPHDGGGERTVGRAVPHHGGLALVGDADGCDRAVQPTHHLGEGARRCGPDLVCVVFHPPGPGERLGELACRHGDLAARRVEGNGPHTRGAGVDGEDVGHVHGNVAVPTSGAPMATGGDRYGWGRRWSGGVR